MKILKENWSSLLTMLFLIVVGILLLVNPDLYSTIIIQIAGVLLAALGIFDLIKYFRAAPEDAAKGSGFYSGAIMITAGVFCLFSGNRFKEAFPLLRSHTRRRVEAACFKEIISLPLHREHILFRLRRIFPKMLGEQINVIQTDVARRQRLGDMAERNARSGA